MNLTSEKINGLQEVINIGVGEGAGVLNEMLDTHINLQIPFIKIFDNDIAKKELKQSLGEGEFSAVELQFYGSLNGNSQIVFPKESAANLVAIITDEEEENDDYDLDFLKRGALTEIGNIVISGVMGAISNLLSQDLEYLLPSYLEGDVCHLLNKKNMADESTLILAQTHFYLEETAIQGDILLIFNLASFNTILSVLKKLQQE